MIHTGDISGKVQEAEDALFLADTYMDSLAGEFERLRKQTVSDRQVREYIEMLLPLDENASPVQANNIKKLRRDMESRYFDAPDLKDSGKNVYRFINAVSDFVTHAKPLRQTANYKENMFIRTIDGNPMIDRAYQMLCAG